MGVKTCEIELQHSALRYSLHPLDIAVQEELLEKAMKYAKAKINNDNHRDRWKVKKRGLLE